MNTDKIFAEAIANEYSVKTTSKVVALKKLDRKAKNPANLFAYTFGIAEAPFEKLISINHEYLIPYLTFIRENRSIYLAAYKNPACMKTNRQFEQMSRAILQPILGRFGIPEREQHYRIAYYIQGCSAIVNEWIATGFKESAEEIADIMIRCIRPQVDADAGVRL